MLDDRVRSVLARMEAQDADDHGKDIPVSERSLAVGPDSGRLLFALVAPNAGCEVLEIGSSHGYSTIWLAAAARILGGRVVTLEQEPGKIDVWRRNIADAGLEEWAELVEGDAKETLSELEDGFDVVFLDAWKDDYEAAVRARADEARPGRDRRRRQRHDELHRRGLRGGPAGRPHARVRDRADRARPRGHDRAPALITGCVAAPARQRRAAGRGSAA